MEYRDETALNIYTDGSSLPNPRRGGVGIVFLEVDEDGHEHPHDYFLQGYLGATNNQMELMAPTLALKAVDRGQSPVDWRAYRKIVIWTDSSYVTENIVNATHRWPSAGWLGSDGAPILNAELWQQLTQQVRKSRLRVEFKWVRGHKQSIYNKRADKLAKASAKEAFLPAVVPSSPGRKRSTRPTTPGSVRMQGQTVAIRVIEAQVLRTQNLNRYRYEVMSPDSPYFQHVDWIVTDPDIVLRRQSTYLVEVNETTDDPRIVRVVDSVS